MSELVMAKNNIGVNVILVKNDVDLPLIQTASRVLEEQGIRHVLVGSAGLKLLNKMPKGYVAADVDFLVDRAPYVKDPLPKEECSQSDSVSVMMDGRKVDYIVTNFWSNNKRFRKYFTKNPKIINGVPVADLCDILGLKMGACREKDFAFLSRWMRQFGEIPKKVGFWERIWA